ncbi:MAG: alanine--tRNA ligase [Candidatus Dadabacteria bacterium]|nr:alanine--tRNA ligase [Candidatus Dadabacteria bacterium]NIQ14649.1 alanine--tRNA ligase [Candidatus Dadabacteria bacterium]
MKGSEVRRKFLEYFNGHDHEIVKSSSLIPKNDPTLLFTNAGMVQFKNVFIGTEKTSYKRATSSQKCVRAGGKHNDLDNVGYTARHHTFFEMLGNFSFGDYFKEEAIFYGWDLLTNVYGLPKDKLWVTVYKDDDEAFDIWNKNIGLSKDRIKRLGEEDNFWSMGDTGPCGPCSEILIDQGEEFGCDKPDCQAGCDCDRYLELWNLVFMQFNKDEKGNMNPLPNPSIDTGMGLERISAVLQGVASNYESDLLRNIISGIEELSSKEYDLDESTKVSMRVIADHSRALAFLISDGVFPSNEGRGYVLRRILRRAVRHSKFLGINEPFLFKVLPIVNNVMGEYYPELIERAEFVSQVVKNEEERFLETIDRGLELLNDEVNKLTNSNRVLPGEVAFKLYDTYGFPVDLTEDLTKNEGIIIDHDGFNVEMEKQRSKSRKAWKGSGEEGLSPIINEFISGGLITEFVGYDTLESEATVNAIIKDNLPLDSASKGDTVEIITNFTPFYGESGGQIGDIGTIEGKNFKAKVIDTKKPVPTLFVHYMKINKGTVWVGDKVHMKVDEKFRANVMSHHTSTHILHAVLKEVLGKHVNQAGSLVNTDKLRFDFSHYSSIDPGELNKIEEIINERIRRDDEVIIEYDVPYDEAIKGGATAIFEEKYGDKVRVVSIGDYSKELCGGTHVKSSGEIGLVKIVLETASSAGVRRVEALSGESAWKYLKGQENVINQFSGLLRVPQSELVSRVKKLIEDVGELNKELNSYRAKSLSEKAGEYLDKAENVNGFKVLSTEVPVNNANELRAVWDDLKQKIDSGVVVLAGKNEEKVFLLVGVTKDLTKIFHAGELIKELSKIIGGKGGGKADLAQAGGNKPENIGEMLKKSKELISVN